MHNSKYQCHMATCSFCELDNVPADFTETGNFTIMSVQRCNFQRKTAERVASLDADCLYLVCLFIAN